MSVAVEHKNWAFSSYTLPKFEKRNSCTNVSALNNGITCISCFSKARIASQFLYHPFSELLVLLFSEFLNFSVLCSLLVSVASVASFFFGVDGVRL